jgi:hypothetical protein
MTIREAIKRVDGLKFNTYTDSEKIMWLSNLDWDVKRNILDRHEGSNCWSFWGYTSETEQDIKLLVPPPWDEMYIRWLEAQIDYHNGENERYNASILRFSDLFQDYAAHYRRTHMPLTGGSRFIF